MHFLYAFFQQDFISGMATKEKCRIIHIPGCICRFALGFCKNIKKRTETLYQSFSPFMVEHRRFELLTPTLPVLCATSCANAPNNVYIITLQMICKGVKSSFFKFLQKNRISAKAVLSRWTSRLLFSYNETYFFSFIPSLQKWRIPMSKPNILWGCERTKSSSAAPFCTKKETEVSHFAKLRMPQDAAVPYFFTRYV